MIIYLGVGENKAPKYRPWQQPVRGWIFIYRRRRKSSPDRSWQKEVRDNEAA